MKFRKIMEGTEYESLEIQSKYSEWSVEPADEDGDVALLVFGTESIEYLYLSQPELKVLVEFLQKQIKI